MLASFQKKLNKNTKQYEATTPTSHSQVILRVQKQSYPKKEENDVSIVSKKTKSKAQAIRSNNSYLPFLAFQVVPRVQKRSYPKKEKK